MDLSIKQCFLGFSYIRAVACIAIIILHVTYSASLLFKDSISSWEYTVSNMVTNCMMWAVPCFIMVTGALLLDPKKEITYPKLFQKYLFRIAVALVLFCMIFRVFDIFMDGEAITAAAFLNGFYEIFTGTSWSHMWYLYLLIGLYLLLPFYKKIAAHSSGRELTYLLVVYLIFLSLLPHLGLFELHSGFYIHVSTIYPFYLFCGYVIHKAIWKIKSFQAGIMLGGSTILIAVLTQIRYQTDNILFENFWAYWSILVIVQGIAAFALFTKLHEKKCSLIGKILIEIDKCSFGIYLIHMIFVRLFLRYMGFNPYKNGGILAFIFVIIGILITSYLTTWILRKIPGLKKIV